MAIYFTRYIHNESIKVLRLLYDEIIGKIEKYEGKKYLMVDDYILDILLDKIKKFTGIKKIDNTKILIDTDDKSPEDINPKNVPILITCFIKDDGKFYLQISLGKVLLVK